MADRFPSPFEMPTPPGAEGWQDLYAYSSVFSVTSIPTRFRPCWIAWAISTFSGSLSARRVSFRLGLPASPSNCLALSTSPSGPAGYRS